jgi:hypothetical protein
MSDAIKGALIGAVVVLFAAFIGLYASTTSDFIISIYPNSQYDVSVANGHFVLYQTHGIPPSPYSVAIDEMVINNGSVSLGGYIEINDLYWYKPYSYPITLTALNSPPGINMNFDNTVGKTPFSARIGLKISANATLAVGPHYITIRGIGQDGKFRDCTCTLMNTPDRQGPKFINIG